MTAQDGPSNGVLWQMLSSVLVILFIGGVALFVIKKVLPRLGLAAPLRTSPKVRQISIIETARLGPQRALHLIQVGQRKLLIGETSGAIGLVSDITDIPAAGSSEAQE